jgi:cytochrome c-type biogenesis protein
VMIPKLEKGGRDTTFRSMFLFGVSYAIASISCTFGVFTAAVIGAFDRENALTGIFQFLAYGLGMAVVLVALTVSIALARQGLLRTLRSAMRYVDKLAGVFMILSGLFLVLEAITQLRQSSNGLVDRVGSLATDLQRWINDLGTTRLGIALGCVIAAAAARVLWVRRHGASPATTESR